MHLQTISTISIPVPILSPNQEKKIDKWLRSVLWDHRAPGQDTLLEVHRSKGRLVFEDGSQKIIQGVREIFEIIDAPVSSRDTDLDAPRQGKIILIGRWLTNVDFEASLARELAS